MRIALVVRRFSPRGGIESNMLAFAKWLVARQHHVQVICQRVEGEAETAGAEIIPVSAPGILGETARLYWFAKRAAAELERLRPDVSYGASHVYGVSVARLEGGLVADHVATVGGGMAERAAARIEKRKMSEAKLVLALSDRDAVRAHELHIIDRVRVVRNGIDLRRFTLTNKTRFDDAPYTVGFIGNGFERKNLDRVLTALSGISGTSLIVAGHDRQLASYRARAEEAKIDATFLGHTSDVKSAVLEKVDVLAMPSLYEPFGLVALEAWACGVPVVLSEIAGASEIAPHPELVLKDPRDAVELRAALLRAKNVDRSRCRAAAEAHPIEQSFEQIEEALDEVRSR